MARRGWGVSIVTAIGVAAGAGAAQLGFGYGLGVITWTPTDAGANDTAWADGLAWATWLAASSTVLGAVCAQRLHQRAVPQVGDQPTAVAGPTAPAPATEAAPPQPAALEEGSPTGVEDTDVARAQPTSGVDRSAPVADTLPDERGGLFRRLSLALGAGLGGLVTVLLVAVPARVAVGADTDAPQRIAALHAVLGILIGVFVALWALRSRAAALNVTATAAWLWLLAVVSVIDGVRVGRGLTGAQLGTWQLDPDHARYWIGGQLYWPGALLALVPALVIGALAARGAARSGGHRIGAAASGAAGPLLVALAYLTTVPRWATPGPAQFSTQLIAPYAVIAGVGGSILAARLAERVGRRRAANRRPTAPAEEPERASTTAADQPEPTPTGSTGQRRPTSAPAAGPLESASTSPADSSRGAGLDRTSSPTPTATEEGGAGGTRPGRRARSVSDAATGTATRRGRTAAAPATPETQPDDATTTPPRVPAPRPAPDAAAPTDAPTPHRARPPRRPTT
ncbi:hypothetical protein AB0B97_08135 [Micromonospora sp. NPDC049004]|uniref:hypothetical protein n=1 Tax=Micromonospora sp. NPDC049004 TaxID=3154348 RepID=UPI0033F2C48B